MFFVKYHRLYTDKSFDELDFEKMSDQDAIDLCIEKYKVCLRAIEPIQNLGPSSCALCRKYYEFNCTGCPIKKYSGHEFCINTPFDKIEEWYDSDEEIPLDEFEDFVREEIEFLEKVKDANL
jgi:hypothetical protein